MSDTATPPPTLGATLRRRPWIITLAFAATVLAI